MCTTLYNVAVIHYDDLVTITNSRESVSNHDTGNSSVLDRFDDLILSLGVKCRGCLVKNNDRGILSQHSGNFHSLTLTAREIFTTLGDPVIITAVTLHNVLVELCVTGCHNHFKVLNGGVPHLDIVGNSIFKQNNILVNDCKRTRKHASVNLGYRLPVKQNLSAPGLIKSRNEL